MKQPSRFGRMKWSTMILIGLLALTVTGIFASNLFLRAEYDKMDKTGLSYWGFTRVLQQPFKHVHIEGGSFTTVYFSHDAEHSLRVNKDWEDWKKKKVNAFVRSDTLYIKFLVDHKNMLLYESNWYNYNTAMHIFSPQLLSVTGHDAHIRLENFSQPDFAIGVSGNSFCDVENTLTDYNTLRVSASDMARVNFKISESVKNKEGKTISASTANVNLQGHGALNMGVVNVKDLNLAMADSAQIQLSGETLKNIKK